MSHFNHQRSLATELTMSYVKKMKLRHRWVNRWRVDVQMLLFWTWFNTYFVGSSSSAPSVGCPVYAGLASDEWRPVPSRAGARHDGSGAGPRCYVSMVGVGEDGDATGGPGRRITVSLPRLELDRYTSDIDDIVRPEFTVIRRRL